MKPKTFEKIYVDDSFCITRKDVWAFRNILNSIDRNISFIIELDCDGKISFLNTLVSRRNGAIAIDVYRKPTHTDMYLDFNTHANSKHAATTAATLLHRALNLLNSSEGKKNGNLVELVQLWSPTVIHLSLFKTSRLTKPDSWQMYPQRKLLDCFLCLSPLLQARDLQTSGLHTRARLLSTRIKTDNPRWSKMAKGKFPKPI